MIEANLIPQQVLLGKGLKLQLNHLELHQNLVPHEKITKQVNLNLRAQPKAILKLYKLVSNQLPNSAWYALIMLESKPLAKIIVIHKQVNFHNLDFELIQ